MIGIFDSGSGGLTVLKELRNALPQADIVYFGDIKNAPYGKRTREELSMLTVNAIRTLKRYGATHIVSACNSVSASLALSVVSVLDIAPANIIEMVGPATSKFSSDTSRILVCATTATIHSGLYQQAFRMIGKDVTPLAFPRLAGLIEIGASEEDIRADIEKVLKKVDLKEFDVILLACTHYPLVKDVFERIAKKKNRKICVVDPAASVANRAKRQFSGYTEGSYITRFLISKDSDVFRARVKALFSDVQYNISVI